MNNLTITNTGFQDQLASALTPSSFRYAGDLDIWINPTVENT